MDHLLHLRVLSALVGIPVILLAAWYGGWALWLLTTTIFLIASLEITIMLKGLGLKPSREIIISGGLFLLVAAYLYKDDLLAPALVLIILYNLLSMVLLYPRTTPLDVFGNMTATFYIGNILFFFLIRDLPDGWFWIILLLTATWASDTFAYFTGRAFGKHKLAPLLSPKKTIEGAVGGVLGSVLLCYIFSLSVQSFNTIPLILIGVLIGVASLLGDLMESAIKRQAGVKDSGQIIPGHGGFLDRFDSLLFTAPLVYYTVKVFII
nr:phosphatidate cytidylyltransferase [Desulforamulus aquiferis]